MIAYFVDWAVILATIGFAGSLSFWAVPAARPFSLDDISIAYPFQTKTKISTELLVSLAIIFPALLCLLSCMLNLTTSKPLKEWRRKAYAANKAILGLGLSIALALLFTDSLKNLMGKPRPDMLSRCAPMIGVPLPITVDIGFGLVTWDICATKGLAGQGFDDLRDGFRSFPSGHSSLSFAGLTYASLFLASFVFSMTLPLARQIRPFYITSSPTASTTSTASTAPTAPTAQPKFPQMLAFAIVSFPMWIAIYIASTRWSDYRHHGFDVLFGSCEGIVCALIGWSWYGVYSCRVGAPEGTKTTGCDVESNMLLENNPKEYGVTDGK
jgi:membrane-associated phospholipid phosphatase